MAGLVASGLTAALRTDAFAQLQESVFYNNEVFPLFERSSIPGGGSTFNVKHHVGANGSITTYSEGDAAGTPGTETYTTAQWPVQYYKGVIQITGHARDQARNDATGAVFFPQIANEMQLCLTALVDRASTDMLGTGLTAPVGLQGICDSAGTIAGIARSSNSWFAAYETAIAGGSYALSDLDIVWQNGSDADYAAKFNLILTSWKQVRLSKGLSINFGSGTPFAMQPGQAPNLGMDWGAMTYGPAQIKPMRDLTNSVYLFMAREEVKVLVMRDWQIDPLGKTDDSDKWLLTGAFGIAHLNPKHTAKLTGA